jgi:2-oxoglutarate dehydrogenase E1 component
MAAQMKEFLGTSYLFGGNAPFIEELYESISRIRRPSAAMAALVRSDSAAGPARRRASADPRSVRALAYQRPGGNGHAPTVAVARRAQAGLGLQLINAHRFLGLRHANIDPLKRFPNPMSRAGAALTTA